MKRLRYILILLPVLLASCSNDLITVNDLQDISELMLDNPKKVLDTLSGVKVEQLKDKEAVALYALLYSQAKDKNWIDETNDSLITVAVDYYEQSDDSYHEFLSYFYWGRVNQNYGNLAKAIVAFTKAEDMVEQINDDYSIGLLYANLGLLYQKLYDYPKSLNAFRNAHNHYNNANKQHHAMYAKFNIGNILLDTKQFSEAENYLEEVIEWAYKNNEYNSVYDAFIALADLYEQTAEHDSLKQMFNRKYYSVCRKSAGLLQARAYVNALDKRWEQADKDIQKAWSMAKTGKDSSLLFYREYTINKLRGKSDKALYNHEQVLFHLDTDVRGQLEQPILTMQKDYYKDAAKYRALQLKQSKEKLIIISIASIIIIVLMSILLVYRIYAKQKRIEAYMDKIQNLETSLLTEKAAGNIVAEEMTGKVSDLFMAQFNLIDRLSTTYYEMRGSNKDKDAIYRQVTSEIEKLSGNKKYLMQLEEIVNTYLDNVMQKTRDTVPKLGEMDYRMLCYIYAGFSAKAISIFTNNSTGNIYMKKKRLKEKISCSDSSEKEIILRYLN